MLASIAVASVVLNAGCAASIARDKAAIMAYHGEPGRSNPCLFGGVDDESSLHCAAINFGEEGRLHAVIRQTDEEMKSAGANCVEYAVVAYDKLVLLGYQPDVVASCAFEDSDRCHASLRVTIADGSVRILDNGTVRAGLLAGSGDVLTETEFAESVAYSEVLSARIACDFIAFGRETMGQHRPYETTDQRLIGQ